MLFPHTSSLYALPPNFNKEDILFVDGIRYASEMVQISYNRLADALKQLPEEDEPTSIAI